MVANDKISHRCDLRLEKIERLEPKLSKREDRKKRSKKTSGIRGTAHDAISLSYSTA